MYIDMKQTIMYIDSRRKSYGIKMPLGQREKHSYVHHVKEVSSSYFLSDQSKASRMATRWVEEGRDEEVLKARTVKVGAERLHSQEFIGGYNLRAPADYRLEAGRVMQYRSVPKFTKIAAIIAWTCMCVVFVYLCIRIGIHAIKDLLMSDSAENLNKTLT